MVKEYILSDVKEDDLNSLMDVQYEGNTFKIFPYYEGTLKLFKSILKANIVEIIDKDETERTDEEKKDRDRAAESLLTLVKDDVYFFDIFHKVFSYDDSRKGMIKIDWSKIQDIDSAWIVAYDRYKRKMGYVIKGIIGNNKRIKKFSFNQFETKIIELLQIEKVKICNLPIEGSDLDEYSKDNHGNCCFAKYFTDDNNGIIESLYNDERLYILKYMTEELGCSKDISRYIISNKIYVMFKALSRSKGSKTVMAYLQEHSEQLDEPNQKIIDTFMDYFSVKAGKKSKLTFKDVETLSAKDLSDSSVVISLRNSVVRFYCGQLLCQLVEQKLGEATLATLIKGKRSKIFKINAKQRNEKWEEATNNYHSNNQEYSYEGKYINVVGYYLPDDPAFSSNDVAEFSSTSSPLPEPPMPSSTVLIPYAEWLNDNNNVNIQEAYQQENTANHQDIVANSNNVMVDQSLSSPLNDISIINNSNHDEDLEPSRKRRKLNPAPVLNNNNLQFDNMSSTPPSPSITLGKSIDLNRTTTNIKIQNNGQAKNNLEPPQ